VIDAPFDVREYNFTLKPEKRSIPATGPVIAVTGAESSPFKSLVDGSGLGDSDGDRLAEHTTAESGMWIADADKLEGGIVFELPGERMLESVAIWNYNKPAYTDMGVRKADISVWTEKDGWKTVVKGAELQEAEGTDDYDEPTVLTFDPVSAEKVRFANLTAFNPKMKQAGLSEICFYEPLGPAACSPEPAEGAQVSCLDVVPLTWTAGRNAVAHDVYIGDMDQLMPLGRIKGQPRVKISGLSPRVDYVWRIDEVAKDGTIEEGPLWSFSVRGSQIGYWKLDNTAEDALGNFAGAIRGEPVWQEGHTNQAIQLDGRNDYVEIPALNLNTATLTICAWINAPAQNAQIPGVVLCRTGQTVAGINLEGTNLRYHWNDLSSTWNWNSGLTVPTDRWVFVALTIKPENGTLYLYDGNAMKSAENHIVHTVEEFDGPLCIGRDSGFNDRYFKGAIDDVRIFDFPLSVAQVEAVARGEDVVLSSNSEIQLVDANLVAKGESLADIANEAKQAETTGAKNKNLIAVLIIILIVVGIAAFSVLRKCK
jgi:hypothetical protein